MDEWGHEQSVRITELEKNKAIARAKRSANARASTATVCEDCGDRLSIERIKAVPSAIRCVACQERFEQ